jgi:DNA processing protein
MVAIVGTRQPTPEALRFTEDLASGLVGQGFAVISGGAAGIDCAAHHGALAAGGQTLVVAPAGWDNPYPNCNRQLFQDVVALGGGYISLVEPHKRPLAGHFFARNAVLVAMAKATVVVQAPVRSGSRNAAHVARKLRRLLYVVPSAPWVERGAGCVLELKMGARPLGTLGDLLAGLAEIGVHGNRDPLQLELPWQRPGQESSRERLQQGDFALIKPEKLDVKLLSDLAPVIQALSQGCRSVDSVCHHSGWNAPKVQSALLHLTLSGCIQVTSAGRIEIVSI